MHNRIWYDLIDKSKWEDGPWKKEPDKIQWTDKETGYPCLIRRSESTGALCGYVGVPRRHFAYGKDYDDLSFLEVHGGLTYSNCDFGEKRPPSFVWEPDDSGSVWILGFDCAHSYDRMPGMNLGFLSDNYRDVAYTQGEVESLASQLKKMEIWWWPFWYRGHRFGLKAKAAWSRVRRFFKSLRIAA